MASLRINVYKASSMQKLISINPANGSVVGEVNITSEKEIMEKVELAHRAKKQATPALAKRPSSLPDCSLILAINSSISFRLLTSL